jgi:beta-lactamase regulating signal transducer with metallopeptidase domain
MNPATTQAIGLALVHFVWQGALVAVVAGLASAALRRARPDTRYALFCGALALLVLLPAVTFLVVSAAPSTSPAFSSPAAAGFRTTASPLPAPIRTEPDWIPWLVAAWLCGVSILAARSLGGFVLAQRMARWRTSPAAESIQRAGAALCVRMGVRRSVRILDSALAEVPAAIGWLRPVVLLPIRLLTTLTPEQIELLLAHELAHVRRHDYLVNLVQTAVETVLFYHPAVWWVGAQIRAEREHCCDDLAVQACGDAVVYARTLVTLEGLRSDPTPLVVAADGGSLLGRIRRLLDRDGERRTMPPAWAGALLPVALVIVTMVSVVAPETEASGPAKPVAADGFLGGLAAVGYTNLSIDEVIALKEHGVSPREIGAMMAAGIGTPSVRQLIDLHDHGVDAEFVSGIVRSGLVSDLSFESSIRLHDHGVGSGDLARIKALGFGPFTVDDVIELHDRGVGPSTFAALAEAGFGRAGAAEAIEFHDNDVTTDRIRSMKRQGFTNLSLEQIVKLRRGGII